MKCSAIPVIHNSESLYNNSFHKVTLQHTQEKCIYSIDTIYIYVCMYNMCIIDFYFSICLYSLFVIIHTYYICICLKNKHIPINVHACIYRYL